MDNSWSPSQAHTDLGNEEATADRLLAIARDRDRSRAIREVDRITRRLMDVTGSGWHLCESDLSAADLSGFNLERSTFVRVKLHGANLRGCRLEKAALVCPAMEKTDFTGADLRGATLHAAAAQCCLFDEARLDGLLDATGALFHGCSFRGMRADHANFAGTSFYQCDLDGASFVAAQLRGALFNESSLARADFSFASVDQLTINRCHMKRTKFDNATGTGLNIQTPKNCDGLSLNHGRLPQLRLEALVGHRVNAAFLFAHRADVSNCAMTEADLQRSELTNARWHRSDASGSNLQGAALDQSTMSDCRFDATNMSHVNAGHALFSNSTFAATNMHRLQAKGIVFRDCWLAAANLSESYLYGATLTGDPPNAMCLSGANLQRSVLTQASITADLSGADLTGANLSYARIANSALRHGRLANASVHAACFIKSDLSAADTSGWTSPLLMYRCTGMTQPYPAMLVSSSQIGFNPDEEMS